MPESRRGGARPPLGPIFESTPEAALDDAELVTRFASARGDSADRAFAALVERHGPLVLGTCRRVLGDHQGAEDAFQATFLILARRAGTFEVRDSLAPWLYRVGRRVALRAHRARRGLPLTPNDERGTPAPDPAEAADLRAALDDEIRRLPGHLRDSVVLCLLEGRTLGEAARRMGCAEGTAGSRLSRARGLLRSRLERRGFAPSAILLDGTGLRVAVPTTLVRSAARLALAESTALIPSSIDLLARLALKDMTMTRALTAGFCLAGCLIAAGSTLALRAVSGTPADDGARPVVLVATPKPPRPKATPPRRPDEPDPARIEALIAQLRQVDVGKPDGWGAAVRHLTQIGRPAVPALIAELDRTTADRPLRALAFTLRAIGDPRAVPALIRAIPRTLVPASSTYLSRAQDAVLDTFLREHGVRKPDHQEAGFIFDRPLPEIAGTLQTLTGQKFNEDELSSVFPEGSAPQLVAKRRLLHRLAERWARWWEANWRQFLDDPAFATVGLPPEEVAGPGGPPPPLAQPFPTGPKVTDEGGWSNDIVGPPGLPGDPSSFFDLDTHVYSKWPDELGDPTAARPDAVAAWATGEGYDLEGVRYHPLGLIGSFYALRTIGLRVWEVDGALYETIARDLREGRPPALDRPAGEYLMHRDPTTGAYDPAQEATFLFATREGGTGILRITGQINELLRPDDFGKPVQPRSPRGNALGIRFEHKPIYQQEK